MSLRSSRRGKFEIFFDLLRAITEEQSRNGRISPTRVQHLANMSYDKMTRYLKEMENFGFISNKSGIKITDKGGNYISDFTKVDDIVAQIEKKYFS